MDKILSFYKKNDRWFIDLSEYIEMGGTEDDCEMVMNADRLCFSLAKGKDTFSVQLNREGGHKLLRVDESPYNYEYSDVSSNGWLLWLCEVTIWLFGEYPKEIRLNVID